MNILRVRMVAVGYGHAQVCALPHMLKAIPGGSKAVFRCEVFPDVFRKNGLDAVSASKALPGICVRQVQFGFFGAGLSILDDARCADDQAHSVSAAGDSLEEIFEHIIVPKLN